MRLAIILGFMLQMPRLYSSWVTEDGVFMVESGTAPADLARQALPNQAGD